MIYENHLRLKMLVPMVFWSMKWFFKDKTVCTKKKKEADWLKKLGEVQIIDQRTVIKAIEKLVADRN